MGVLEIYFKTQLTLDCLAERISNVLDVGRKEMRDGINRGGIYYQFHVFGLCMELLRNAGEVEVEDRADYAYYMISYSDNIPLSAQTLNVMGEHIVKLMGEDGVEAVVDCST